MSEISHNHDHENCLGCQEREQLIKFYKSTGDLKNVLIKDSIEQIGKNSEVKDQIIEVQKERIEELENNL